MTGNISVKTGKALSTQSDYDENARYKRRIEKINEYSYWFEAQFGGNPNYDPKKLAKTKKTLLNYIPQSTDNEYQQSVDKIEQSIKYQMLVVKTYKNGYVKRNGWKVKLDND